MNRRYTGIGSRKTPQNIIESMIKIGRHLAEAGWELHSGGAGGADTAFEMGAHSVPNSKICLWLPWPNFNNRYNKRIIGATSPSAEALKLVENLLGHSHWENMRRSYLSKCNDLDLTPHAIPPAHKLHARNAHQILGGDLKSPVSFVCYWAPVKDGQVTGGTATAVKLAIDYKIPTFNLFTAPDDISAYNRYINVMLASVIDYPDGSSHE